MAFEHLKSQLEERSKQGLLRTLSTVENLPGAEIMVDNQRYLNFSGNDYLGMSQHPEVLEAATSLPMAGAGASPVVTGHSLQHQKLCEYLQTLTGQDAVMLFTSGFAANHAICQTLLNSRGWLVADKLSHASIIDGALASKAVFKRFAHNDTFHLAKVLQSAQKQGIDDVLVVSEGVFSMDGDAAPLPDLLQLCEQYQSWLMMDYAHAIGCQRADQIFQQTLNAKIVRPQVVMATFGKAVGTGGAFVAASHEVISYLQNFARHSVYSTAFSPAHALATLTSLKLIEKESWRREKLSSNIAFFRRACSERGIPLMNSGSAIQPVVVGDPQKAVGISNKLKAKGYWVSAIRTPTVPKNTDRLRITLTVNHEHQQIAKLLDILQSEMRTYLRESA